MRAAAWLLRQQQALQQASEAEAAEAEAEDADMEIEGQTCVLPAAAALPPPRADWSCVRGGAAQSLSPQPSPAAPAALDFGSPAAAVEEAPAQQPVAAVVAPAAEAALAAEGAACAAEPEQQQHLRPTPFEQPAEADGGGLSEPTVTISTRDAFAALNDMFGVSTILPCAALCCAAAWKAAS